LAQLRTTSIPRISSRIGKEGCAITSVTEREHHLLRAMEKHDGSKLLSSVVAEHSIAKRSDNIKHEYFSPQLQFSKTHMGETLSLTTNLLAKNRSLIKVSFFFLQLKLYYFFLILKGDGSR